MEKKNGSDSKKIERKLNYYELRSLRDLQYAFFCCDAATRYLDSLDEIVKDARNNLFAALDNFYSALRFIHKFSDNGAKQN